jgi:hypothetical protein
MRKLLRFFFMGLTFATTCLLADAAACVSAPTAQHHHSASEKVAKRGHKKHKKHSKADV